MESPKSLNHRDENAQLKAYLIIVNLTSVEFVLCVEKTVPTEE